MEKFDEAITCVRIVHPGEHPEAPWASVDTARWADTPVESGPLRHQIEHHMRRVGERFSAVAWSEGDATIVFDGRPTPGRIVRAGDRWWAARCTRNGTEVSIVAHDWHPAVIMVATVTDPVPLLARLRPAPPRLRTEPEPEPVPPHLSREPHRALVDVILQNDRQRTAWLADGGPAPELPGYWSTLWDAAVRRQMALADQPETEAERVVSSTVNHLAALSQHADWFHDDARLRERAIAETLLYGTGISDTVPSRAAQRAWERRHAADRAAGPAGAYAADQQWLDAWTGWARRDPPA
ncbi:MAG TPA: hypothetical protein VNV66_12435 [Pilimelia sp.]|nr:hypothetical protein [Pilimelia sp.]